MKKLSIFALLLLSGCATTAPSQVYRPSNAQQSIKISGDYNEFSTALNIYFDGNLTLQGKMPIFSDSTELNGNYGNYDASAVCTRQTQILNEVINCMVFIDNERATTLTF